MIRSSESLMAEDVTIRCRVRRSPHATNPKFEEAVEMTCTMRNWDACGRGARSGVGSFAQRAVSAPHPSRAPTPPGALSKSWNNHRGGGLGVAAVAPHNHGPELLLTPLREILTNRDDSHLFHRGRRTSSYQQNGRHHHRQSPSSSQSQQHYAYSIPISDILIVDTKGPAMSSMSNVGGGRKSLTKYHGSFLALPSHHVFVTTFSYGLLEFQCQHQNGVDIFMAFLKASLPPERVLDRAKHDRSGGGCSRGPGDSSSYDSATTASDDGDGGFEGGGQRKNRHRGRRKGGSHRGDRDGPTIQSSSSVTSCLDVDAFTAAHLRGRAEQETWPEKMTRRVGHVVNSLSDLSTACCDGSWCGGLLQLPGEDEPMPPRATSCQRCPSVVDDDDRDDHSPPLPTTTAAPHAASARPSSGSSLRRQASRTSSPSPRSSSSLHPGSSKQDDSNPMTEQGNPSSSSSSSSSSSLKRQLGYSDLEMDEQDSQLPAAAAAPGLGNRGGDRPPPSPSSTSSSPRRYNSAPNAKRLELSRKSSC